MNTAIRYGLILGAISVIYKLATYAINVELLVSTSYQFIVFVVSVAVLIYFARLLRQARGGFASFKEMFGDIFTMLMISIVLDTIFNYILFNFIDPQLAETLKNATIKNAEAMFSKFGMSGEQVDAALAEIEKQDMSVTVTKSLQQILMLGIVCAIISAIVAAFMKKNKPEEAF
ncbi:MAG: DUF4199 domain-containing protein [Cytophagales bacterium]|nr:DUF4199 domain-containing protein [Bernardetiaceae bacterium]MDW8205706.1 DUF4199 domain-containing protein [Cytophagales bacterium]